MSDGVLRAGAQICSTLSQIPTSRKNGKLLEQDLLIGGKESITPLKRSLKGLLT